MSPHAESLPITDVKPRDAPLRLLFAGIASFILVLFLSNAGVILSIRESELVDAERQLTSLSLTLAEQADRSFRSIDLVLTSIAETANDDGITGAEAFAKKMAGREIHLRLREKMTGLPQIDAVTVIGHDGKLLNFSRFWPALDIDVSDRDYFQALKSDASLASFISAPVQSRSTGDWTIYLAHRVSGPDGAFLGLIVGAIEMRYFEDFFRAISPGGSSALAMLRSDGLVLARVPPNDLVGKTLPIAQRFGPGTVAATYRDLGAVDGGARLLSAHRLPGYPILTVATMTGEVALSNWRRIAGLMSLAALGCAIFIAAAGVVIARQWKQQTRQTVAATQAERRQREDRAAAFEAMRTAKEAAEAADRAKSEFLATMSHELRTPLNAVLGFSEVIATQMFGPLGNDLYRDYARDIYASGNHLLGIINDLLDLAKATAGNLQLVDGWIDARDIVNAICVLIRPRAEAAHLSLAITLPPGDLGVFADARLLKQMLLNLLSNACKFTPPGGRVECRVTIDEAGMTLTVSDTGIGIPAEDIERVVLPFVQVDGSLSRRHEGTGLGLPLVKVIAELHDGSLLLVSEVGRGTTAMVVLPPARLRSPAQDAPARAAPPRNAGALVG